MNTGAHCTGSANTEWKKAKKRKKEKEEEERERLNCTKKEWYKTKANKYEFHYSILCMPSSSANSFLKICVCVRSTFIYHIFVVIYFTESTKCFASLLKTMLLHSSVSCPNNHNNFCLFNSIKQKSKRRRKTIKKPCWLSLYMYVYMYMCVRLCLIVVLFVYEFVRVIINTHTYWFFFRATI